MHCNNRKDVAEGKMKKVCVVCLDFNASGGIPRTATILMNNLKMDPDIKVAGLSIYQEDGCARYSIDSQVTVDVLLDYKPNFHRHYHDISQKIVRYFSANEFDVVIVAGMDYVPVFWKLSGKKKRPKLIAWEHANSTIGKKFGFKWFGRKIAEQRFDHIVVLTDEDKQLYCEKGFRPGKITRIYNPRVFLEKGSGVYPFDSKKIISCGALIEQKGFDYLVEIAKKVMPKHPDWIWNIYGEGALKSTLKEKIQMANLEEQVFLRGYAADIAEQYMCHGVFALTSRFEGFGMVIIEALQAGLPVISFDCKCGPKELIENGKNGVLIHSFELDEYATKLDEIMTDTQLRLKLSDGAKVIWDDERFAPKQIYAQWVNLIRNL